MKEFALKIITPEKITYQGQAVMVSLPTTEGEVGILANHVPYMAALQAGEVQVRLTAQDDDSEPLSFAIDFGVAEFVDNELLLLVAQASAAADIDLQVAQAARESAEKLMATKIAGSEEYAGALAVLEREMAKIKVANKYRLKHRVA